MKYAFVPDDNGTHTRTSDGARGNLLEFPDTVQIFPESAALSSAKGYKVIPPPPAPPAPVPGEIANWRAKAVLGLAGLLPAVEVALNAVPEPNRTVALAAWNGGADLARNGPTVLALAATLGLTDAQVDDLFRQASALEV
jgi:hypothetical protein